MITFSIFSGGHPTAKDEPNVPATEDGWQHWQSAVINKECNVPLRIELGKGTYNFCRMLLTNW